MTQATKRLLRILFAASALTLGCGTDMETDADLDTNEESGVGENSVGLAASFMTRNCAPWQEDAIQKAADLALTLLKQPRTDAEYLRWFGNDTQNIGMKAIVDYVGLYAQESLVLWGGAARRALGKTVAQSVIFDCNGGRGSLAAHVSPNQNPLKSGSGVIFLDNFWSLSPQGRWNEPDSQAGTIIHELTHLWGSSDFSDGESAAFNYALTIAGSAWYPYSALNASNYEFFYQGL